MAPLTVRMAFANSMRIAGRAMPSRRKNRPNDGRTTWGPPWTLCTPPLATSSSACPSRTAHSSEGSLRSTVPIVTEDMASMTGTGGATPLFRKTVMNAYLTTLSLCGGARRCADAQPRRDAALHGVHIGGGAGQFMQHGACAKRGARPQRVGVDALVAAFEQPGPEAAFELAEHL